MNKDTLKQTLKDIVKELNDGDRSLPVTPDADEIISLLKNILDEVCQDVMCNMTRPPE